jgi:hypothetical protein
MLFQGVKSLIFPRFCNNLKINVKIELNYIHIS